MRIGIAYRLSLVVLVTVLVLGGSLGAFFAVEQGRYVVRNVRRGLTVLEWGRRALKRRRKH